MSAALTFWKRFEDLFRQRSRLSNGKNRIPYADVDLNKPEASPPQDDPNSNNGSSLAPWARWRGRHAELRENFLKVNESLDRMHEQFERTEQRNEGFAEALDDIRSALASMANQQEAQHELIDRICERMVEVESRTERAAKVLHELPAALHAQADAIQSVSGQLDASRKTDETLRNSLDNFEDAAREMRESGAVQIETLSRLQSEQAGSREELEDALTRQNRRFAWVAGIATFVSLAALGALVANLLATGLMPLSQVLAQG